MEDCVISPVKPVFEVIEPGGHAYRIWADGRAEGFGASAIIINRVPWYANAQTHAALNERRTRG